MTARILVAVVCIPALVCVLIFLPAWGTSAVVGIIAVVSAYEFMNAAWTASAGKITNRQKKITLAFAVFSAVFFSQVAYTNRDGENSVIKTDYSSAEGPLLQLALITVMAALFFYLIRRGFRKQAHEDGRINIFACHFFMSACAPFFLSRLTFLRIIDNGEYLVLLPFAAAFITDAGAYFVGIFYGRHHPFPKISPKKTVEGYAGGLIAGIAGMMAYGVVLQEFFGFAPSYIALLVYGVCGAVATEAGDLLFSYIKRGFGVKDFGNLLPGHGGVLDRFDSMVLAAPAIWALTLVLPVI